MKQLYYILLILLLASCVSVDKAINKATKTREAAEQTQNALQNRWAVVVAAHCKDQYPILESTVVTSDTTRNTIVVPGDSVECPGTTEHNERTNKLEVKPPVKVKCPDVTYQQEQIRQHTKTIQESTAALEACQLEAIEQEKTHNRIVAGLTEKLEKQQEATAEAEDNSAAKNKWIGILVISLAAAIGIILIRR